MTKLVLVNAEEGFHTILYPVAVAADVQVSRAVNKTGAPKTAAEQIIAMDPDLVMVGVDHGVDEALAVIEAIDRAQPGLASVLVTEPDATMWQRALRSGARDLISPDVDATDLKAAIERGVARTVHKAPDVPDDQRPSHAERRGRVLTIASPKGGCGKTMLATSLAYGLQMSEKGSVVIVDFDLQFGDVSSALGLRPEYTLGNAVRAGGDATTTKSFLTPHPSGLFALCAPANPAEAETIEPKHLADLLVTLESEFDWVIVDTSAGIGEPNLVAVEAATDLAIVATTDLAAIQAMRKAVVVLDQIGLTSHRRWYVLNRANARVGLDQHDIEDSVGEAIDATIPSSRLVPIAMNQGITVLEEDTRSPAARAVRELLDKLAPSPVAAGESRSWLQRILP